MARKKVWYITGASKGMGLAVTRHILAQGYAVAATSRDPSAFHELTGHDGEKFLPLQVDLHSEASIEASFKETVDRFGTVDVILNNAGYGLGGALEELTTAEIEDSFDINFFAAVRVIQKALPYLRRQRSGHIINISSIAGFAPGSGWAMYSAAKFAVSGLSAALAEELGPLGIKVTNVLPGWFRTNFASADSIVYGKTQIEDYSHLRTSFDKMTKMDGAQAGDPNKVAAALLELVGKENPARNLFLGSDAVERAHSRIKQLTEDLNDWERISASTDFTS